MSPKIAQAKWHLLKQELWGKPGTWIDTVQSPSRQVSIEILRLGSAAAAPIRAELGISKLTYIVVRQEYHALLQFIKLKVQSMNAPDLVSSYNRGLILLGQSGISDSEAHSTILVQLVLIHLYHRQNRVLGLGSGCASWRTENYGIRLRR